MRKVAEGNEDVRNEDLGVIAEVVEVLGVAA